MEAAIEKDSIESAASVSLRGGKYVRGIPHAAWIPFVLALFFSLSALRGVSRTDIVDTDAARHAMNGAFIYDMIRGGHIAHPVEYAKQYYGHLPALSMPFHPPLFPAIEALFFAVFGVTPLAARGAVAVTVGICVLLLYRLVQTTLRSRVLAACLTLTTFSLWTFQFVARSVMLEFPALMFALAALCCLGDGDRSFTPRRALLFGVFAGAAVWTKQQTVFLGLVPLLCASWKGRHLRAAKPVWISTAIFGVAVLGWILLSKAFYGTGTTQTMAMAYPGQIQILFVRIIKSYIGWIASDLLGLPGVFALCSIAAYIVAVRKVGALKVSLKRYYIWIISAAAVLLTLGIASDRYFFFLLPAVVTVGYAWLFRGCGVLWGKRRAEFAICVFAAAWLVAGLFVPVEFLRGPGDAAALVAKGAPSRVLYAGTADGNFIFAIRSLDPKLQITVIPGGKLPPSTFEPAALEQFCRQYGINWIVFENVPGDFRWSGLTGRWPASMKFERSFPGASSRAQWRGTFDVYSFMPPANPTGGVLELPVWYIRENVRVEL